MPSRIARFCLCVLAAALIVAAPAAATADAWPNNHWHLMMQYNFPSGNVLATSGIPGGTDQTIVTTSEVAHSTDGGRTWVDPSPGTCDPQSAAIDPQHPATIYCADNGLYRSDDSGATWTLLPLVDPNQPSGQALHIGGVAIAQTPPYTVYAVASDSIPGTGISTVFVSTDRGQTWTTEAAPGFENDSTPRPDPSIAVDPTDADHLVVTGQSRSDGVWRDAVSTDGGATWVTHDVGGPIAQPTFDPANPARIWARGDTMLESTDGGADWNSVAGPAGTVNTFTIVPGAIYVSAGLELYQSLDDGVTWRGTEFTSGGIVRTFAHVIVDPADVKRVFVVDAYYPYMWQTEFDNSLPAAETYDDLRQDPVTEVTPTTATLTAEVAPMWDGEQGLLEWSWGADPSDQDSAWFSPLSGTSVTTFTHVITGLTPNTTYTVSLDGVFGQPFGYDPNTTPVTFTTPPPLSPGVSNSPRPTLIPGQVSSGHVPVKVAWTQTRGTYPRASTKLGRREAGGVWAWVGSTSGSSLAVSATLGRPVQFRVAPSDDHGNAASPVAGTDANLAFKDDAGTAAIWSANWKRVHAASAVDKTLHTSTAGVASVTLHFTGRSVAVIAPKGRLYAQFKATLDGHARAPILPRASALAPRRTVAIYSFAKPGKHTLVLHVVRSISRKLAALDGFVVLD